MVDLHKLFGIVPRAEPLREPPLPDPPGSSLRALKRKRAELGTELVAVLYRYREECYLVSSVTKKGASASLESGVPTRLPMTVDDSELGRVVCQHLLAHVAEVPVFGKDFKASDWPAYRASKAKSITGFKAKSFMIRIEFLNGSIRAEAQPTKSLHPHITVTGWANPEHHALGTMIRRILRGADALRAAGVV